MIITVNQTLIKKDIDRLERVQRRAATLIPELRILSYVDRVQQCKLTTLETRRVRGDQIAVFEITHGVEGLDSACFLNIRQTKEHEDIVRRWLKNGANY